MTLDAVEFLRRFVLHVLPRGFQRIRHFSFLANRIRPAQLAQCRTLLPQTTLAILTRGGSRHEDAAASAGETVRVCPVCHQGHLWLLETLHPHRAVRDLSVPLPRVDTS